MAVRHTDRVRVLARTDWWLPTCVAYALIAALCRPLTSEAAVAVLVPGLVLLAIRVRRPVRPLPPRAHPRAAVRQWTGVLLAFAVWEAVAWRWGNDADHPTLSLLFDPALEHYPVRVVAFLGWLTLGHWLVTR